MMCASSVEKLEIVSASDSIVSDSASGTSKKIDMQRPASQPAFLPSISLALDDEAEGPFTDGSRYGATKPPASPAKVDSSHAFDPIEPQLSQSNVQQARREVERAREHCETIIAEKDRIHEDSKVWYQLDDQQFSGQLRDGAGRMKKLDFEEGTARKSLDRKRSIESAIMEALTRQDEALKRARLYQKARQETAQAAQREQQALGALAKAKTEEGMAKRALQTVGQVA